MDVKKKNQKKNVSAPDSRTFLFITKALTDLESIVRSNQVCGCHCATAPQWGIADAEIKVQSVENPKLKDSHCKTWSSSEYSHAY